MLKMQASLLWLMLILILAMIVRVRTRKLAMVDGSCPMRDITCADGHENVVSVLFSVESAKVSTVVSKSRPQHELN